MSALKEMILSDVYVRADSQHEIKTSAATTTADDKQREEIEVETLDVDSDSDPEEDEDEVLEDEELLEDEYSEEEDDIGSYQQLPGAARDATNMAAQQQLNNMGYYAQGLYGDSMMSGQAAYLQQLQRNKLAAEASAINPMAAFQGMATATMDKSGLELPASARQASSSAEKALMLVNLDDP